MTVDPGIDPDEQQPDTTVVPDGDEPIETPASPAETNPDGEDDYPEA